MEEQLEICDEDDVEQCSECCDDRCRCDDIDEERSCDECLMSGPMQCSVHGDAEIQHAREMHEHYAARDAMKALVSMPDAWQSAKYKQLVDLSRDVLADMVERCGE